MKARTEAVHKCKQEPQLQEPKRQNPSPSFVSGAQEEEGKEGGEDRLPLLPQEIMAEQCLPNRHEVPGLQILNFKQRKMRSSE